MRDDAEAGGVVLEFAFQPGRDAKPDFPLQRSMIPPDAAGQSPAARAVSRKGDLLVQPVWLDVHFTVDSSGRASSLKMGKTAGIRKPQSAASSGNCG